MHLVEADLLKEYAVSRASIREVFSRLTGDGLVELVPHKGIMVRKFSIKELKDMYTVLECLECHAIRLLADSNNTEVEEILGAKLVEIREAVKNGDFKQHVQLVNEFHYTILDSTGNDYLKDVSSQIMVISRISYASAPLALRMNESLKNHKKMLDAIKNHDADLAEALLKLHLRTGIELISDNWI